MLQADVLIGPRLRRAATQTDAVEPLSATKSPTEVSPRRTAQKSWIHAVLWEPDWPPETVKS
jgi:hypothetical protein